MRKFLLFILLLLSIPLSACQKEIPPIVEDPNDFEDIEEELRVEPFTAKFENNRLIWDEVENAVSYTITIRRNEEIFKTIDLNSSETREIDFNMLSIPYGNIQVTLTAKSNVNEEFVIFTYFDNPILNLIINETAYKYTNPIPGYLISSFHQGIEFQIDTDIYITEITDKKLVGTPIEQLAIYEEIKALYQNFLTEKDPDKKLELAKLIGNDLIVTYYYIDDFGNQVHFYTKQKYWTQYLNNLEDGKFFLYGKPEGYFNTTIEANTYRTAINFQPNKIDMRPFSNKMLYTEVILIFDGTYAIKTISTEFINILAE